jgi:hypothetical protein
MEADFIWKRPPNFEIARVLFLAVLFKCALKLLDNQADFDSATPGSNPGAPAKPTSETGVTRSSPKQGSLAPAIPQWADDHKVEWHYIATGGVCRRGQCL